MPLPVGRTADSSATVVGEGALPGHWYLPLVSSPPAALGVDFGTSHTVAAVRMPGGRIESLLFDASSPLLPSAVFAQPHGDLLVGQDALRASRLDPGRLEPNPKRHVDDGTLLLGDVEITVEEVIRAVLTRVAQTGRLALGAAAGPVVLTHPASWGARRRGVLVKAAAGAGLGTVRLVAEPVAAALYFTEVLGHRIEPGGTLVVYDLGGGTFDISAVRRSADSGWEVLASAGLDDVGGVDIDAAIVDWMTAHATSEAAALGAEPTGGLPEQRRWQLLLHEARAAKEQLSRGAAAPILLPGLDREVHLTRDELEHLARPLLERTVALTTSTLFTSGVVADQLAGVFLVGGSSRMPLVATMLHRALGVAPTVIDQPELVVAHGSLCTLPPGSPGSPASPGSAGSAGPPGVTRSPKGTVVARASVAVPVRHRPAVPGPPGHTGPPRRPTPDRSAPPRRGWLTLVAVLLVGTFVGATMTAYPVVTDFGGSLQLLPDRYAWQLMPVAGVLVGLWTRRWGAAVAAQAVSGVVAGLVGLAMEGIDRTILSLPWGTPVEFYYWSRNPDAWFLTLVGGCLAAGLAVEMALAVTTRLGLRHAAVVAAVAVAAGMLPCLLLLWIFDWESRPSGVRTLIDTIFAYPVILLLAWPATRTNR